MPNEFTRSETKLLRRLADEAWDAELRVCLLELHAQFDSWANQGISSFELVERIHEFHNGASRQLYGRYTSLTPALAVARAVAFGLIADDAMGAPLREKLDADIDAFRELGEGRG
ncbi:hypothetical protein OPU71_14245 [Niveibacterium sp. 24ML]|uniref:hypothetical protein n=1 Tax=Niveibacterium sp. 24ML TaxID=2985512 RepID=UPI00226D9E02|nr:hypothetical protein [Niveibacterium sp. 24ML]MCX9157285.1 hypothetical protein [Niveibacterium sp. 24ML]